MMQDDLNRAIIIFDIPERVFDVYDISLSGSEEIFSHGHGHIAVYVDCRILESDVCPWFEGKPFVLWKPIVMS